MKAIAIISLVMAVAALNVAGEEPDINPVEFYNQFIKGQPAEKALMVIPSEANDVMPPRKEWQSVTINSVSLPLPLREFTSATRILNNGLVLRSKDFTINILDLGPSRNDLPYPSVSFDESCSIFRFTVDDLLAAKTKENQKVAATRMLLKVMSGETLKQVVIVNAPKVKAIITRYARIEGKPSSTSIQVWSPDGHIYFHIMIGNEPIPDYALQVLGGIRFTGDRINAAGVSVDIERICSEFVKQKPDSQTPEKPAQTTIP